MAKKATTMTKKNDVTELVDWLEDEIDAAKDDAALEILELLKSDDPSRWDAIGGKMVEYKTNVVELKKVLAWCNDDEENQPK